MGKPTIRRIGDAERKYVEEVLASDFSNTKNPGMLRRFEQAFAEKVGTKFAIAHVNGTATLHSALYATGVRAGDEVITTPLTMSSPAFAILQADAVPVFADVREDTLQIDPDSIERLITPRTKAIMTIALYGLSPDMDPIMAIARKHGIKVIEDNAETFMSTYKGKTIGSIGDLSSYSLQATKHVTAGEGGMVCTDDPDVADAVRRFSVLGYSTVSRNVGKITKDDIQAPDFSRHVQMGYNYRMSELCAAVALGQLEHAEELVQRRIDVANLFLEAIHGCEWLVPQKTPADCEHSYWSLPLRLVREDIPWKEFRKKFMELGGDGIYAAWKLSYLEPMFQDATRNFAGKEAVIAATYKGEMQRFAVGLCPVAEKVQPQILAFKTNYWDWSRAEAQAEVLKKTIRFYDGK
ncbi:MAG: DegT/DnrJ/EryC1/StrS family aminotransferase [Candidatus Kaiserbacteria bacterium]|nr:DegT/DnrJ/EryC1/StrS family aminotransferase [Candidatus Kaiserbacteria bacterium]